MQSSNLQKLCGGLFSFPVPTLDLLEWVSLQFLDFHLEESDICDLVYTI